jgi:hypothetical protein
MSRKERIMNFASNMEAMFIVALALASASGIAGAGAPSMRSLPGAVDAAPGAPSQTRMALVTVSDKPLGAASNAASGAA